MSDYYDGFTLAFKPNSLSKQDPFELATFPKWIYFAHNDSPSNHWNVLSEVIRIDQFIFTLSLEKFEIDDSYVRRQIEKNGFYIQQEGAFI